MVSCPTDDVIGDFFTKPNQGALFIKLRDMIMGVDEALDPGPGKAKGHKKKKAEKHQDKPGSAKKKAVEKHQDGLLQEYKDGPFPQVGGRVHRCVLG